MAEVRRRFGRGAFDYTRNINTGFLLKTQTKQSKDATRASCLSAGLLLGDYKAGGPVDRVTVGVSRDAYTRVTAPLGTLNHANITECHFNNELEDISPSNEIYLERKVHCKSSIGFRRTFAGVQGLFPGPGPVVFVRPYSGNGAWSEPLYKTKTGYYEILQVSSSATQAQIKTAYYKQSFVYHPDRNSGSEAATLRFSEINEAYTVLGNKALRKKYDRGLLSLSDLTATVKPSGKDSAAGGSSKQQSGGRGSVAGAGTAGTVFDLDTFLKKTYNEQLQRQRDIRVRKEEMIRKKEEMVSYEKYDSLVGLGVLAMVSVAIALLVSLRR